MTTRANRALALVEPEETSTPQFISPQPTAWLPAMPNRTQQDVVRRHETNRVAILAKTMEAAWASQASYHLTQHAIHCQVEAVLAGNALVRQQQHQDDYDDVRAIVDQMKQIHNDEQQRLLATALNALGAIIGRPLIVDDKRDNLQRFQDRLWGFVSGEPPEG